MLQLVPSPSGFQVVESDTGEAVPYTPALRSVWSAGQYARFREWAKERCPFPTNTAEKIFWEAGWDATDRVISEGGWNAQSWRKCHKRKKPVWVLVDKPLAVGGNVKSLHLACALLKTSVRPFGPGDEDLHVIEVDAIPAFWPVL